MPLEPELEKAVQLDVSERGQPEAVARRLIAWLEELSKTEVSEEDQARYLDNLRKVLVIPEINNED